ncbi:MAG: cryptochrome/photolyase family protein [Bacteroidales bacterium]|nr:cryptochrome/photolyase family protein [Bacteroidales bacterium]
MNKANLIFPHQLFENSPLIDNGHPLYLVEESLFFNQYAFHRQKLAFHRASMKFYQDYLDSKGIEVIYIEAHEKLSDVRSLISKLAERNIKVVHYIDPTDNWLEKRIENTAGKENIDLEKHPSPMFLNTKEALREFFKPHKKKFSHNDFYIRQRKKHNILIDDQKRPVGGKWSFDADNRKKYPRNKQAPVIEYPQADGYFQEALEYVNKHFPDNPGSLHPSPIYPANFNTARESLQQFLENRFAAFGPYEDAIVAEESILHHSVLSPLLNAGLITPGEVMDTTLRFAGDNDIPLNSLEGFIRQIIGWREFIRGMYEFRGSQERTRNFWQFSRKIPPSFYDGTTGIDPVDVTIKKVLSTGYCHHIERLMVLGNFMLLCEFDPDEVYRWFMELFIDAYDWVMVPNVYGMSQFADGGMMATKPYISGSNYLMKMSNYPKGPWQDTWNALFWRFMHIHRDFFTQNPRLGMLVRSFDKMPEEKQKHLLQTASDYLDRIQNTKH